MGKAFLVSMPKGSTQNGWLHMCMCTSVGTRLEVTLSMNALCRLEVRPSMKKFASDARILEVCALAQYAPGYLNRQLITLLMENCLGVPDDSFRELQVSLMGLK